MSHDVPEADIDQYDPDGCGKTVGFVNLCHELRSIKTESVYREAEGEDHGNGYHVPVKAVLHAGFKVDAFLPSDYAGQKGWKDVEKPFEKDDDREDGYQCENVEKHVSFLF
jgi:hypothetical protein